MSHLLITEEDIRKAVIQYYKDYEPALVKVFDFDVMHTYIGSVKDNLMTIEFIVEEKK
jgi:hypothetical protein